MSLINCSELVTDPDFAMCIHVKRPRGGFDGTGVWAVSGYESITMSGHVQPAGPEALKILPEGERPDGMIEVWTAHEVRLGDGEKRLSDVLLIDGQKYRVISVELWPHNGQCHAIAISYKERD